MPEFDQFLDESFADLDASFPLYQALLEEDFAVNSPDKVINVLYILQYFYNSKHVL